MCAFCPVQAWSIVGVAQAPVNDREGADDITGANAPDHDHNILGTALPTNLRSVSKKSSRCGRVATYQLFKPNFTFHYGFTSI